MLSPLPQAQRCVLPPEKQQDPPPRLLIFGQSIVVVGNAAGVAFAIVHTGQKDGLYLVAGVLGVPLVHYAEEWGEVVILRLVAIHAVIDCNKAYLLLGKQNLGIKADLKIVSAETAHILDDNCADFPGFGFCKHCLKSGTVEVTPCVTVIFQKIVCKKFVILKIHINCNLCYSIEK